MRGGHTALIVEVACPGLALFRVATAKCEQPAKIRSHPIPYQWGKNGMEPVSKKDRESTRGRNAWWKASACVSRILAPRPKGWRGERCELPRGVVERFSTIISSQDSLSWHIITVDMAAAEWEDSALSNELKKKRTQNSINIFRFTLTVYLHYLVIWFDLIWSSVLKNLYTSIHQCPFGSRQIYYTIISHSNQPSSIN